MSYKVKGTAGPVLQDQRYAYDPSDGTYYLEQTWGGSERAIRGQSADFRARNLAHNSFVDVNGTGQTVSRTPILVKGAEVEASVRYEIATEFIEQDGFRHKTVSDAADNYDSALTSDRDTFRREAENAVNTTATFSNTVLTRMIAHLKKGVTGFEREYIVLRRSRKLAYTGKGSLPQATILDGRFIYSTEQLGLPPAVAFSLPILSELPTSDWDDVQWGWRRRPSSVVFTGDFVEQSSEFTLAEWSLLYYEIATGAASW